MTTANQLYYASQAALILAMILYFISKLTEKTKMITAQQALKDAKQAVNDATTLALANIEKSISGAVKKGETSCYVYFHLNQHVLAELKRLGFSVTDNSDQRDGVMFTIDWSK